jgi:hypothetical protein
VRSLATTTTLLLFLGLIGSRPCSCEIRQKLAASSEDEDEGHSCCHEPEPVDPHRACVGCLPSGAERGAVPACGGRVATAGIVDRDGQGADHLPPAVRRLVDPERAPVSFRGDVFVAEPVTRSPVFSTVMLC